MSDILLEHTADGGDVRVVGGRVALDEGPATAAYLSLFGGNELDAGTTATISKQWWGNRLEQSTTRHLRSETQHLLRALPATSGNLAKIADAIGRDLAWMKSELGAAIRSRVSMPAPKRLRIDLAIDIDGSTTELRLEARWGTE